MSELTIAINKETVTKLPPVEFDGSFMVVDTLDSAKVALRELSRARVIGFDTETRPSFKKGVTHNVALMQLSTDDFCFLFRINHLGIFQGLKDFLENPEIIKIGVSVHDDFKALSRTCEIHPQGFIDLQDYAKQFCIADNSLQKIYAIVFERFLSKSQRLTNWEAQQLTVPQQRYAAIDAWASLKIYKYLRSGAFKPEESAYIVKEVEPVLDAKETEQ